MDASWRWFFLEGLIPLVGASGIFLCWGVARMLVNRARKPEWSNALDPVGWLYGGLVIACTAASRSPVANSAMLTLFCVGAAVVAAFILMAALNERAEDAQWRPPTALNVVAIAIVAGILYAGFLVQTSVSAESERHVDKKDSQGIKSK